MSGVITGQKGTKSYMISDKSEKKFLVTVRKRYYGYCYNSFKLYQIFETIIVKPENRYEKYMCQKI